MELAIKRFTQKICFFLQQPHGESHTLTSTHYNINTWVGSYKEDLQQTGGYTLTIEEAVIHAGQTTSAEFRSRANFTADISLRLNLKIIHI